MVGRRRVPAGAPPRTWRVLIAIALSWALAVGVTRVYLGVHWPTDVLGGWLLAAALVAVALAVGADVRRRVETSAVVTAAITAVAPPAVQETTRPPVEELLEL